MLGGEDSEKKRLGNGEDSEKKNFGGGVDDSEKTRRRRGLETAVARELWRRGRHREQGGGEDRDGRARHWEVLSDRSNAMPSCMSLKKSSMRIVSDIFEQSKGLSLNEIQQKLTMLDPRILKSICVYVIWQRASV